MVVRAEPPPKELVDAAIDALYGVTVHGLVLNDVDPRVAAMLRIAPYGELPAEGAAAPRGRSDARSDRTSSRASSASSSASSSCCSARSWLRRWPWRAVSV